MDEKLHRDIGRLEGTVDAQGERIDALDAKLDAHNQTTTEKLDRILAFQEQQKGAGRFGLILATALGTLGGLVVGWFKS